MKKPFKIKSCDNFIRSFQIGGAKLGDDRELISRLIFIKNAIRSVDTYLGFLTQFFDSSQDRARILSGLALLSQAQIAYEQTSLQARTILFLTNLEQEPDILKSNNEYQFYSKVIGKDENNYPSEEEIITLIKEVRPFLDKEFRPSNIGIFDGVKKKGFSSLETVSNMYDFMDEYKNMQKEFKMRAEEIIGAETLQMTVADSDETPRVSNLATGINRM